MHKQKTNISLGEQKFSYGVKYVPGKLKASPVQQPATPALMTESTTTCLSAKINHVLTSEWKKVSNGRNSKPSSLPRNLFKKQTTRP